MKKSDFVLYYILLLFKYIAVFAPLTIVIVGSSYIYGVIVKGVSTNVVLGFITIVGSVLVTLIVLLYTSFGLQKLNKITD